MIADLKPYAEYKESGLPWLGQMPGHWPLERTKWRFRNRKELNASGVHTNILSLTLRGVVNNNPDDPEGLVPKDYRTYQFFAKGDLVFKLIDLENLRTSRVGLVHEDGIMSSAYVRLAPSSPTNIRYFFHQFYDLYSRGIYNQLGAGVRSTLGPSDLLNVGIVIPPPAEQAAIGRFLDWANGRLERAIRAKRKVIVLLNEQKQAIIHRAVTRGLDPNVSLKPSGIPWLGDIPQHWEVLPLKRIAWFKSGAGFPVEEQGKGGLEIPFLKVSDMTKSGNEKWIDSENNSVSRETARRLGAHVFPANSIIFPKVGGAMLTNKRRLLRRPSCIDNNVMGCVVDRGDLDFVFVMLEQLDLGRLSKPGPVPAIGEGEVREIRVAVPPVGEQQAVVRFIREETRGLIAAISRLEREIELLREYRTRLVADVVTGKLDVLDAAARLPDEAAPETAEDDTDVGDEAEAADEEAIV